MNGNIKSFFFLVSMNADLEELVDQCQHDVSEYKGISRCSKDSDQFLEEETGLSESKTISQNGGVYRLAGENTKEDGSQ